MSRPVLSRPQAAVPPLPASRRRRTPSVLYAAPLIGLLVLCPPAGADDRAALDDPAQSHCSAAQPPEPSTPALAPLSATVVSIAGGHAFVIDDGREVRLAGIGVPRIHGGEPVADTREDPAPIAAEALAELLKGQRVRLFPISELPDRHGRLRARAVRESDGLWIEAAMVGRGLVRVEPRPDDHLCARHLQSLEAKAREQSLGMWADPRFAVLSATDPDLARWAGRYVLVEGKVISTGVSGTRRYLNFGPDFRRDFAVVLDDKGIRTGRRGTLRPAGRFAAEGFTAAEIVGRTVRVRGVLTVSGGGLMVPSVPEEIEWADGQP